MTALWTCYYKRRRIERWRVRQRPRTFVSSRRPPTHEGTRLHETGEVKRAEESWGMSGLPPCRVEAMSMRRRRCRSIAPRVALFSIKLAIQTRGRLPARGRALSGMHHSGCWARHRGANHSWVKSG